MLDSKSGFRGGGAGDGGRRAETSGRSLADRDGVNASDRASGNPLPGLQLDHAAAVKIDEDIERAPRAVEHGDRTPATDRHAIDLRVHRARSEIADVEPGAEQQAVVDADVGDDAIGRMAVDVGRTER